MINAPTEFALESPRSVHQFRTNAKLLLAKLELVSQLMSKMEPVAMLITTLALLEMLALKEDVSLVPKLFATIPTNALKPLVHQLLVFALLKTSTVTTLATTTTVAQPTIIATMDNALEPPIPLVWFKPLLLTMLPQPQQLSLPLLELLPQ